MKLSRVTIIILSVILGLVFICIALSITLFFNWQNSQATIASLKNDVAKLEDADSNIKKSLELSKWAMERGIAVFPHGFVDEKDLIEFMDWYQEEHSIIDATDMVKVARNYGYYMGVLSIDAYTAKFYGLKLDYPPEQGYSIMLPVTLVANQELFKERVDPDVYIIDIRLNHYKLYNAGRIPLVLQFIQFGKEK